MCGGPVEQVEMVPKAAYDAVWQALGRCQSIAFDRNEIPDATVEKLHGLLAQVYSVAADGLETARWEREAMSAPQADRIRTLEEQVRVCERLLARGNTLGGVVAAALDVLAAGREVSGDQLRSLSADLRAWTADVRAVASEEAP
ncbi:MAG: hypothetical protein QOG35_1627 [Solirubrobacteraceae bacterium]|nr:hypothetical protein [Solirubrobacteraceae bacterium]